MSEGEQSSTRARSHTSATASAKKDPKGSSICHDMPWIPDSSTILRDSSGVREEIGSEPESPKSSSKPVPANKPSLSLRGRQNANPDPRTRPDVTEPYYPPACVKAIARQLQAVEQDPLGSINIVPISNNLTKCRATIKGPDNTPYANGTFYLSVNFPSAYPFEPPEIKFLTRVYHFNFDHHTGDICLKDHLKGYWSPSIHILDILLCLRALLLSPNERDPYLPEVGKLFYADPEAYEAIAKLYTEQYAYKLSDNDDLVKN
ncbi:ubiquitin-conjugating enzyme/RWD-like protein [Hyaloscypha sp. PMI_1271]|nr:ubiquitin-conjugating enzyme/RWD-like protein [Hyaloscypha sp. PMI_1271]